MSTKRKLNKQYHFSVEGETELWYLERLQKLISEIDESTHTVSLKAFVQKDPLKHAKKLSPIVEIVYHICDYESNERCHNNQFIKTMDRMKEVTCQKNIDYKFGYSNLTFDLWIILHKQALNHVISHRDKYLDPLNRAYNEQFENMDEYKKKANFERILRSITLSDVINAVARAKDIMRINKNNDYTLHEYKGYKYYRENPSLLVWEPIEQILRDCGLM
ncbi:MAG: RloB family protein [Chitinispirillales bacterium]|jgi:hypothetical protein|nr:RloB family protein [Chitinispirillales bacterium]